MISDMKCCYVKCREDSALDAMWKSLGMIFPRSTIVEAISDLDKNSVSVVGAKRVTERKASGDRKSEPTHRWRTEAISFH